MIPGTAELTPRDAIFVRSVIDNLEKQKRELHDLLTGGYAANDTYHSLPSVAEAATAAFAEQSACQADLDEQYLSLIGPTYRPIAGQKWGRDRDPDTGVYSLCTAEEYLSDLVDELESGTYATFRPVTAGKDANHAGDN